MLLVHCCFSCWYWLLRIEFVLTTEFRHKIILRNETYTFICLCVVKGIVLLDVVGDKELC